MNQTVFEMLWDAVRMFQTGTVNIRRILAPLFAEATAEDDIRQFYTEFDAADDYTRDRILAGVANAGLYLPDRLPPEEPEEPEEPPVIVLPESVSEPEIPTLILPDNAAE